MGLALVMKFDEHGRIIWPPLPSQTAAPASEENIGLKGQRCDISTLVQNSEASRITAARCCAAWSPSAPNTADHHHADARQGRASRCGKK